MHVLDDFQGHSRSSVNHILLSVNDTQYVITITDIFALACEFKAHVTANDLDL